MCPNWPQKGALPRLPGIQRHAAALCSPKHAHIATSALARPAQFVAHAANEPTHVQDGSLLENFHPVGRRSARWRALLAQCAQPVLQQAEDSPMSETALGSILGVTRPWSAESKSMSLAIAPTTTVQCKKGFALARTSSRNADNGSTGLCGAPDYRTNGRVPVF